VNSSVILERRQRPNAPLPPTAARERQQSLGCCTRKPLWTEGLCGRLDESPQLMTVRQAIRRAEATLPGVVGGRGPRWQVVLGVGEYSQSDPDPVWSFIECWGQHEDADLRMAIGLCLLEHLLGYHFELIFPRVERAAMASARFADTFRHCRRMGQAETLENSARWDVLLTSLPPEPAA
jgi:hypothetical protein